MQRIKTWYATGDTHGRNIERLGNIYRNLPEGTYSEEVGVIILGDAGYNFWLNKTDVKGKQETYGMTVYCVRGNHEERPENLGYTPEYDEEVQGHVYIDPINNKIRYLMDGHFYKFGKYGTLVLGGAYSVDKWHRLKRAAAEGRSFTGWFKDEQLTQREMNNIEFMLTAGDERCSVDLVLSHTCPIAWEPTELFIQGLDQSMIDKTMERWLGHIEYLIDYKLWLFGHFHGQKIVTAGAEMMYQNYKTLDSMIAEHFLMREVTHWGEVLSNDRS